MSIKTILEWLIPDTIHRDSMEYTRVRILAVLIICNFLFVCAALLGLLGLNLNPAAKGMALMVSSFCLVLYCGAVLALKTFKSVFVATNLVLITAVTPPFLGINWTGGTGITPMDAFMLMTPLICFIVGGLKLGFFWCGVAFFGYWTLLILENTGAIVPHQFFLEENLYIVKRATPVGATIGCVIAMVVYEYLNSQVRLKLNDEGNLFAYQASHDALTDLANRESFNRSVELNIDAADLSGKKLALVYLDLDGFKPVNDTYGHDAGDQVLKSIGGRLHNIVRGGDTVGRLGGDEFAVTFFGYESPEKLEHMLIKILETVSEPISVDGKQLSVGASLGVAIYPDDAKTFDKLCRHADMAMYKAKESKNTWKFFGLAVQENK